MTDLTKLDPFTTVWKASHRRRSSKQTGKPDRFHLDPNCPLASGKILKGRLGAALAHKWELCLYESSPGTWNKPINHVEEGRRRAEAALARGGFLGVSSPIKRTVHLG